MSEKHTLVLSSHVVVTLAALNEAENVGPIIEEILDLGYRCVLVDDGSTDATSEIAKSLGAMVVNHDTNLGQGEAVLTGFKAALMLPDCEIIVEMDADGQHQPSQISRLVEKMCEENTDIVVGSRILGSHQENTDFLRRTFLPHYTALINWLTKYHMTDALCGFRAFRRTSLRDIEPVLDSMLEPQYLAAEMFVRFSKAGLTVAEVPIELKDRTSGISHKGVFRYGFGILQAIIRTLRDIR